MAEEATENKPQAGFGERIKIHGVDSPACGSITKLHEGKKTEMHFHLCNDKVIYVLGGTVGLIVIDNGVFKRQNLQAGASVAIKRGLVHQFEGVTNAVLVEFGSYPEAYKADGEDFIVVEKGSAASTVAENPEPDTPSIVMSDEDKSNLESAVEAAEESLEKTTPTKKKRRKKKTSRKN